GADLLEGATFTLQRGRRYGLIGRNGSGKSTLLRSLASRQLGDIPAALTIHYVRLDEAAMQRTPLEVVLAADVERSLLLSEAASLQEAEASDAARLAEVLERLDLIGADAAEQRALALLRNLGFSAELRARPMAALSGGWRVRTCLAAAIFAKPDVLMLDEPTNHLSIGAVLWLMRELTTSPAWSERIVVVVSHDRVFLDAVATDVLHLSAAARRLTQSHGNYATWAKRREQQQKTFERATALRAEQAPPHTPPRPAPAPRPALTAPLPCRARPPAASFPRASGRQAQDDHELPLSLQAGGEISGPLVQLRGVAFGYSAAGEQLFSGAELGVDATSRIVLLGENGNGKTTPLLLGDLAPTAGEVVRNGGARIGLVNQHHADQIDLTLTPLQFLMDRFPGDGSYAHEQALRSRRHGSRQPVPSSALSGGQRSRVALAAVSYAAPHVLVLDEPTNNLDLESIAALADCVTAFKGGVVLVSHDQYFVSRVANEVWVVE
ncbi:ABC transporter protein, partial [Emiliania huxleyi CCMP1516]|uniref:ABC transporter domain-containing protein n=2 Tax=Emiliania huxleyi TaxID=2903 RepID=A0A0D3I4A7_EMIH1